MLLNMVDVLPFFQKYLTFKVIVIIISFIICIAAILIVLLKAAIAKWSYSKHIPSRSIEGMLYSILIRDLLGLCDVQKEIASRPVTALLLQYIEAHQQFFKDKPLFAVWVGFMPFIFLNKPEAVEEVLNGTKANEKAWFYNWFHCWLGTGLLTSHGKKWKSRRKLLTPAFHFDILKDFLPSVNEKSMQLVKNLRKEINKDFINVVPHVTLCALDVICETTLGLDIKAQKDRESEYVKAVARVTDGVTKRIMSLWRWFDTPFFLTTGKSLKKDVDLLHAFTMSVIRKKKKDMINSDSQKHSNHKRKPLIDVLLEHHFDTKDLTEEDIREEVDTFTFEGHDTTSMAMAWALYLIGHNKDVQTKIHEELDQIFGDDNERPVLVEDLKDMKYLECVLKESLRIYPSVPLIGRRADADLNICGYFIPKGSTLVVVPYSLHRNEDTFPNPEVFDPDRFLPENSLHRHPYSYIPFSAGPRNCIGQRFAVMEEKTVIANILRNFEVESLDPRDQIFSCIEVILRSTNPIRLKFKLRDKGQNAS